MSSEKTLQLVEEEPPLASISLVTARENEKGTEPQNGSTVVVADKSRSLSVQERRILAARDINTKIESLESEIAHLTGTFGQSQEAVRATMMELQHRSVEIMADVMRVTARLEQSAQHQGEQTRALETRFSGSVSELGRQLSQTGMLLQEQKERLDQLQDNHDTLQRLHDHLEKVTYQQGRTQDVFAAEARQQIQLNRTHIDGLNALYREQQQALLALTSDHELLAIKSGQVEAQLAGLTSVVTENMGRTRKRFRVVAGVMAALAVLTLGLIAYFQLYPSAVPETVKTQLASLSADLDLQSSTSDELRGEMGLVQGQMNEQMAALNKQVKRQSRQMATLDAESRQTAATVKDLQKTVAALQEQQNGNTATAAMPPALPGSRPSL